VQGTVVAAEQLDTWIGQPAQRGVERKLFGNKRRLREAMTRARAGTPAVGEGCPGKGAADAGAAPWRLTLEKAPVANFCALKHPADTYWFSLPNTNLPTAVISVSPGPEGGDPCLPRLSVALLDESLTARLRFHADYSSLLSVELVGDRCQLVDFVFDPKQQAFAPALKRCR
jgi:hypothetical protein